jgi:hypothetical protein
MCHAEKQALEFGRLSPEPTGRCLFLSSANAHSKRFSCQAAAGEEWTGILLFTREEAVVVLVLRCGLIPRLSYHLGPNGA